MNLTSIRKINSSSSSKGFTLVETLVAISILMIAVAGPLTLSQKALSASMIAKDQIVASYLAQDALEYIRGIANYSDGNWFTDTSSADCMDDSNSVCQIDTTSIGSSFSACGDIDNSDNCPVLKFDEVTGTYSHSPNSSLKDSKFKRYINLQEIKSGTDKMALKIIVNVKWNTGGIDQTISIKNIIYKK